MTISLFTLLYVIISMAVICAIGKGRASKTLVHIFIIF